MIQENIGDGPETIFQKCGEDDFITCKKVTFATYLATATLGVSLVMTLLFRVGPLFHAIVSIPLVITWGFGVPYVTFADNESTPAAIYFAFWGGTFLSIEIATINIMSFHIKHRKAGEHSNHSNEVETDLSAKLKEASSPSKASSESPSDPLGNLSQSNIAYKFRNSEEHFDRTPIQPIIEGSRDLDEGFMDTQLRRHSRPYKESLIYENKASETSIEHFVDENEQQDEKSSIKSFMSSYYASSNASTNFMDCNEYDSNEFQDYPDTETRMVDPRDSQIEQLRFDDSQLEDGSSTMTPEFVDCSEFEPFDHP